MGKPIMERMEKDYCVFCRSNQDDVDKLGQIYRSQGITVHYFCMLFASGLVQNGRSEKYGIMGFMPCDIMKEVRRASRLKCNYCRIAGATIGCVMSRCRVVFHFPCGLQNNALNQYMGEFKSYCEAHRPQQKMPKKSKVVSPEVSNSVCIMCMSKIEMKPSNTVLYTPCCKNSWFHRDCLQRHAVSSGLHFFRCPLCNDKDLFQKEMLKFGIHIPDQDAAWEREPNAFQDLLIRHSQCDVDCICPYGREYKKQSSKWDLMLCDWCGSSGTHIACSHLKSALDDWVCKDCYQICGKDVKKLKQRSDENSHPTVSEERKCRHSVHCMETCDIKRCHSRTNVISDEERSTKRLRSDRRSHLRKLDGRHDVSQPLVSDHVVLGSRLKEWTPEERQFGCQAQVHLTMMTSDMILKAKVALSKCTRKSSSATVRYRQIDIKEAFAKSTQKVASSMSEDKAQVDEKNGVTVNTSNVFTDIQRKTGTKGVITDNDSSVIVNSRSETFANGSVVTAGIIRDGACGLSNTVTKSVEEDAAGESTQQMVTPVTRMYITELVEMLVTPAMDKDGPSFTSGEANISPSSSAAVPTMTARVVPGTSTDSSKANRIITDITNTDIRKPCVCQTVPDENHFLISPMNRLLSYPEFVEKYFSMKPVTLYTKLMYYQSYWRTGLLPEIEDMN